MSYFFIFFQDKNQEHEDKIQALSRTVIQQAATILAQENMCNVEIATSKGLDIALDKKLDGEVERLQTALNGVQVS